MDLKIVRIRHTTESNKTCWNGFAPRKPKPWNCKMTSLGSIGFPSNLELWEVRSEKPRYRSLISFHLSSLDTKAIYRSRNLGKP